MMLFRVNLGFESNLESGSATTEEGGGDQSAGGTNLFVGHLNLLSHL